MQFMLAMVGDDSGWEMEPGPEMDEMLVRHRTISGAMQSALSD